MSQLVLYILSIILFAAYQKAEIRSLNELCLDYIIKSYSGDEFSLTELPQDYLDLLLERIYQQLKITENQKSIILHKAAGTDPRLIPFIFALNDVIATKFLPDNAVNQAIRSPQIKRGKRKCWLDETTPIQKLLLSEENQHAKPVDIIKALNGLVLRGATFKFSKQHQSPLIDIILYHNEEVGVAFIDFLDNKELNLQNPLYWACIRGKIKIIKKLIEKKILIDGPIHSSSPLQEAVRRKRYEIAELLLKHGANPNNGALSIAVMQLDEKMVELLLKYNADPTIKITQTLTPLKLARLSCNQKMLTLMNSSFKEGPEKTPLKKITQSLQAHPID